MSSSLDQGVLPNALNLLGNQRGDLSVGAQVQKGTVELCKRKGLRLTVLGLIPEFGVSLHDVVLS